MNPLLHISFTEHEMALIKEMLEKEGYRSMSEIVRFAVREHYDRRSLRYRTKRFQDNLTPEQICVHLGGEVFEENGIEYCRLVEGSMTTEKPLSTLKT